MADLKDNIIRRRIGCFKEENKLNKVNKFDKFIILDETDNFVCDDEVMVFKCSDFPEVMDLKSIHELKVKIDELRDNAKRVKELNRKLKSAQETYKESINDIKIKMNLQIDELKDNNSKLEEENKKLKEDLKKVNIRVNEINNILKESA